MQLLSLPLLMRSKLPTSVCRHVILHAASFVCIKLATYHNYSPLELVYDHKSNISHLRILWCAIYVPIALPQRIKMSP